jgi:hypothetical protein
LLQITPTVPAPHEILHLTGIPRLEPTLEKCEFRALLRRGDTNQIKTYG